MGRKYPSTLSQIPSPLLLLTPQSHKTFHSLAWSAPYFYLSPSSLYPDSLLTSFYPRPPILPGGRHEINNAVCLLPVDGKRPGIVYDINFYYHPEEKLQGLIDVPIRKPYQYGKKK
jgi:hypothetical protein